jgi:hypothetical protein
MIPSDRIARLDVRGKMLLNLIERQPCGKKDALVARGAIGGRNRKPFLARQRIVLRQYRATPARQVETSAGASRLGDPIGPGQRNEYAD